MLWDLYQRRNGIPPSKEEISFYSNSLNLTENQIYKWFWDTKKRVEHEQALLLDPTDQTPMGFGVDGMDGRGEKLSLQ